MVSYGHLPDPIKKAGESLDFSFSEQLLPKLPPLSIGDVDLRVHTTPTHQYGSSSCVGNAVADAVEILNSIEGQPKVQLSRLFVYTLCRNLMDVDLDGRPDINKDEGTYIRLAFEVLSKFGICREDVPAGHGGWPYDLKKLYVLPDLKAMRAATGWRIHSYYKIYESGNARLERVLQALRSNHPVVFGTRINESFTKIKGESYVGIPSDKIVGSHAMIVVGYISGLGFIVKNSWGTAWGNQGFFIMEPEYLAWSGTSDLWVPTRGINLR